MMKLNIIQCLNVWFLFMQTQILEQAENCQPASQSNNKSLPIIGGSAHDLLRASETTFPPLPAAKYISPTTPICLFVHRHRHLCSRCTAWLVTHVPRREPTCINTWVIKCHYQPTHCLVWPTQSPGLWNPGLVFYNSFSGGYKCQRLFCGDYSHSHISSDCSMWIRWE